jgi:hypothetical protein
MWITDKKQPYLVAIMLKPQHNVIAHNGGDWRSKSLALPLKFSTTLDGFYFANCVLADAVLTNFK